MFKSITPTTDDETRPLPGDELISNADSIITSAFELLAPPTEVYPWLLQLGKHRAGWYFTRFTEKFFFPSARGIWYINPEFQKLEVGQRIPDYGKDGYFDCFYLVKDKAIGYKATRGKISMTWVLTIWPGKGGSKVVIRLRVTGLKRLWLFSTFGRLIDKITISWLAAGLKQRLNH